MASADKGTTNAETSSIKGSKKVDNESTVFVKEDAGLDENDDFNEEGNFEIPILVGYNNPVLIDKPIDKKQVTSKIYLKKVISANYDSKIETFEALNMILPSREWEDDNGQFWRETISNTPATQQDVIHLQKMLDFNLKKYLAQNEGFCDIRRELYTQCLEEIIRQVTINCVERGLLLAHIRDEINMTMQAYTNLYLSSIKFGLRKALMARDEKEKFRDRVKELEIEIPKLKESLTYIKIKYEQANKNYSELREAEKRKYEEEIELLKKSTEQLVTQLKARIDELLNIKFV